MVHFTVMPFYLSLNKVSSLFEKTFGRMVPFAIAVCFAFSVHAREEVLVSVTHFPPFYNVTQDNTVSGLGIDLLDTFNKIQDEYLFKPVIASAMRRHKMFDEGRYDLSFFDHMEWGWQGKDVDTTEVYLEGGEVFITANEPDRDQSFFKDIERKSIAAMLGYHYRFADYVSDPQSLKRRFDIVLTDTQDQIIKLVLNKRVDIGIITETYLKKYFQTNLTSRSKILQSQTYDHPYKFRTILRKNGPVSVQEIEQLINTVRTSNAHKWIKEKYGIDW